MSSAGLFSYVVSTLVAILTLFTPAKDELYAVPLDTSLQIHIIDLCEKNNIEPATVFGMIEKESAYQADVIGDGGNSFGLMQIQPRWHQERMDKLGCPDLLDPYQNTTVGIDYMAELLEIYDGDIAKALTAYNQGSYKGVVSNYAIAVLEISEEIKEETK